MKFFADISVEAGRSMVYNFFASYHGSGLWDAHFAKNNAAIRNFLIHMEGLRKKCESKDFSPLAELKALAHVLLAALDNTVVYEFCNINRDVSLKPRVKPIRDIKQYHCFQYVDADHVNCCIMCGDAFSSIPIQFQPVSQSTPHKHDDDVDEKQSDTTQHNIHHLSNIDMDELRLDVQDDDVADEEQPAAVPEQTSSSTPLAPSSPIPARRTSKRQRTSLFSFSSCKGDNYYDIDDIDLD